MTLYITLALYFIVVKSSPLFASFVFTLSVSIKAGALLLLPSFLGWIQYQHGVYNLLLAIIIVVGFQILIASPVIYDGPA